MTKFSASEKIAFLREYDRDGIEHGDLLALNDFCDRRSISRKQLGQWLKRRSNGWNQINDHGPYSTISHCAVRSCLIRGRKVVLPCDLTPQEWDEMIAMLGSRPESENEHAKA